MQEPAERPRFGEPDGQRPFATAGSGYVENLGYYQMHHKGPPLKLFFLKMFIARLWRGVAASAKNVSSDASSSIWDRSGRAVTKSYTKASPWDTCWPFGRKPSWIAVKKGHGAVSTLLLTHDRESNIAPIALYKTDSNEPSLECDVCTSRISRAAFHFHCNLCAGGDWDICEVCRECGATCMETAHVLVKRTMVDGLWSEVT